MQEDKKVLTIPSWQNWHFKCNGYAETPLNVEHF